MSKKITGFRLLEENRGTKPFAVDREKGVIAGVKIIGRESRNNREYTSDALSKAKSLYEGAKVYVDHRNPKDKATRSYRDGFGELRNISEASDGLYGDLHYNRKHPLAEQVAEDAERFPGQFGLSHDANGTAQKRGGKWIVESVDSVNSVDIVGRPATTNGLFEAELPQETRMVKTTVRSLVESITSAVIKAKFSKHLKEMDGTPDAAAMDSPVDVPDAADMESGGSEDQIDSAFKAMVNGVLDDDSLDTAAKLAKIKLILTSQDKLLNGSESKSAPADAGGDSTKTPATEGAAVETGKLLEEIRNERRDMKSERLLESAGIEVTDARLKILRTANEAETKELLEGWPKKSPTEGKPRPAFPGRKTLQEGVAADAIAGAADARKAFGMPSTKS